MKEKISAPFLGEEPLKEGLGLALDLGTREVGAYLYDLKKGVCLAFCHEANRQELLGKTVEDRIAFCASDKDMLKLTALIREQVFDLILSLTGKANAENGTAYTFAYIHYVAVAGNTVMEHLYAATSPRSIGEENHKPVSLFGEQILAEPTMYFCPCLSGFAGGDLTADLLGSGCFEDCEGTLLLDLGSRTGFAFGTEDGFLLGNEPEEKAKEAIGKLIAGRKVKRVLVCTEAGRTLQEEKERLSELIPEELLKMAEDMGNAAGYGACLCLSQKNREKLKELTGKCRVL